MVVTGLGIICPLGLDVASTWQSLLIGKSGVDYITLYDTANQKTKIAGEVKDFIPSDHMSSKDLRRTARFTQFALVASRQAADQAKLHNPDDLEDTGVIIGSALGALDTFSDSVKALEEEGERSIPRSLIPMILPNSAAGKVSLELGAKGPSFFTASACSTGNDALGAAYEILKRGDAKAMIVGGSEAAITPVVIAGLRNVGALSTHNNNPHGASCPFDSRHSGFVVSEGAAVLVLESLSSAEARGVEIFAEILGYGSSSDAFHTLRPEKDGAGCKKALQMAFRKAQIDPSEVDYINAHGCSSPLADRIETLCLKNFFGGKQMCPPISSTKSMLGHMLGGSGAIEAVIGILSIQKGIIPPTINLDIPDPDCDLDYVPKVARPTKVNTVLSNSLGFGGHNSVLIFRGMHGHN